MITEETARFLIGDDGQTILDAFAKLSGDTATRMLALRKRKDVTMEIASAVVELTEARARARRRFGPVADDLFWTSDGAAQATSPVIAEYHARKLAPFGSVADLGCGIGMDTLAFARAGLEVVAVERDAARLVFAQENARISGLADKITFVAGDATKVSWSAKAAYLDPSRRDAASGLRISKEGDRYEPSLFFAKTVAERAGIRAVCMKLSPALPDDVLGEIGGRVDFLSDDRECKEACVWLGESAGDGSDASFTALLLPEEIALPRDSGDEQTPVATKIGGFVFDPDPAIVRVGALGTCCTRTGAIFLSPDDAYLSGLKPCPDPRIASSYTVLETLPYVARKVAERLKAMGAARLVVKKRHYGGETDTVLKELGFKNREGREITLIIVRQAIAGKGGFLAVLCEPTVGGA